MDNWEKIKKFHEEMGLAADDGAWKSTTLGLAKSFYVTLDRPGVYRYHCVDYPWAIGSRWNRDLQSAISDLQFKTIPRLR